MTVFSAVIMYCAYCGARATVQIPAEPADVCLTHAIEFWTGLLLYARNRVADVTQDRGHVPGPNVRAFHRGPHARVAGKRLARAISRASVVAVWMLFASAVMAACGSQPAAPSRPPDPALPVPIDSQGPVRVTFVGATIAPGGTITGCGPLIEGCAGRLMMTFLLSPPSDGPVLYARLYLHATNLQACLWGEIAPFTVRARVPVTVEMPLDRADLCRTPTDIATMALVVDGTIEVASRQTWTLRYLFAP